jgi:hypothetical protein
MLPISEYLSRVDASHDEGGYGSDSSQHKMQEYCNSLRDRVALEEERCPIGKGNDTHWI